MGNGKEYVNEHLQRTFFFSVNLWAGSGTISFGYYVYKWGNRGTHPLNSGLEEGCLSRLWTDNLRGQPSSLPLILGA